ncbi:hypothetical protein [Parasedimentitalea maritima]|uniref:Uncharacterized protein n=1 Tax=Parasedimentitalea maritima TaxID=2578117 RepID=A0A6A4RCZ8_9RHOB|nr:hypothetical protein [Zongyanglinia marina]KAE9631533.1 hypothetical protein GP644_04225 [Zongyanglinia marina]
MRPTTAVLLACLSATSFLVTKPAVADVYECTFEQGHIAKPTPTRVVIELDAYQRIGKLLKVEIPGVVTQPRPLTVKRNNIRVASVQWQGRDYKFTPEAMQKGASGRGGNYGVNWYTHGFSVFLNKKSMKALTRSVDVRWQPISSEKSGICVRLD